MAQTTSNYRIIKATATKIYNALTDPKGLETWQVPGDMTGKVHRYDLREGGSYVMSLFYPDKEDRSGKTSGNEDRFTATFVKLDPPKKIIESIRFDTDDPHLSAEMRMEITLEPMGDETKVTFLFSNIPPGIKPADNEKGTLSSLEKLAHYVEGDW